ncbi:MAG: helix-turn-helix domain-containing protein [Christensenellales bacterium]
MDVQGDLYEYETYRLIKDCHVAVNYHHELDEVMLHHHDFIEIAFVESGYGWHVLNGRPMLARPGDLFVINHGDVHYYLAEYESTLSIYNLIFRPGFFDLSLIGSRSFEDVVNHFLLRTFRDDGFEHSLACRFYDAERERVLALFRDMLREYEQHEPGFEELIRSWTIEILIYLFRKMRAGEMIVPERKTMRNYMFDAIFDYLRKNYAEPVTLDRLAMMAFLSPKYFSRVFKEQTGMTFTEYVQGLRVKRACELLEEGDLNLCQIAQSVGYADYKSFLRVFKKITGESPSDYRRAR